MKKVSKIKPEESKPVEAKIVNEPKVEESFVDFKINYAQAEILSFAIAQSVGKIDHKDRALRYEAYKLGMLFEKAAFDLAPKDKE